MLKKLLKPLAGIFLFSFIFSSSVEGRVYSHARPQTSSIKRKTPVKPVPVRNLSPQRKKQVVTQRRLQRPLVAKRPQTPRALIAKRPPVRKPIAAHKPPQKATPVNKRQVVAKKIPPRTVVRTRPQIKQIAVQRKRNLPTKTTPNIRTRQAVNPRHQSQQKTSVIQAKRPSQPALKRSPRRQTPLARKTPVNRTAVNRNAPRKTDYLSLLPFHNQNNAKAGGLDKLLARDLNGGGQTVAVIELSGEWKPLKEAMNGKSGFLAPQLKTNYKANFLTPIGGPGLHPEEKNDWLRDKDRIDGGDSSYHGSSVSSVILDFAPQAKVLPVSTYNTYGSSQFYDIADALKAVSQRSDVSVINMSSGYTNFDVTGKNERKKDGSENRLIKRIYPPRLIEAFKAVAKAGKVVVIATGNEGEAIDIPQFRPLGQGGGESFLDTLCKN